MALLEWCVTIMATASGDVAISIGLRVQGWLCYQAELLVRLQWQVVVKNERTKDVWNFRCEKWLAPHKGADDTIYDFFPTWR